MTVESPFPPRLADGVELLGEFKDSGFTRPPSLVRRSDGQVLQMSRLLYQVARRMDGSHGPVTIAHQISGDLGRPLSPGQVCYLIVAKLAPLGILAGRSPANAAVTAAGAPAAAASPLLSLRARGTLLPARAASATGTFLRPLFHWPVIAAVIAGAIATDCWIFFGPGLSAAFGQVLANPADLLLVAALTVGSALFHECGHAAACRYGGARPGRIGVGIYLVWPSFFTNVTDSYRLDRTGRLRTDLGGIYFNLIFILGLVGLYAATGAPILLLVIVLSHLEMLEQLMPFARFDGYFILSDLIGVPDLFAHVVPVLRGGRAGRHQDPGTAPLQRRARTLITGWVCCVIPVLALIMGYLLLHLPAATRALWHSGGHSASLAVAGLIDQRYASAGVDALSAGLAVLSIAGSLFIVGGLVRRAVTAGLRWSAGRSDRQRVVLVGGIGALVCLSAYWVAQGQFSGW